MKKKNVNVWGDVVSLKIVKKCLNCKCRSKNIRYDRPKLTLHCDTCKTKWKVKEYVPPVHCPECGSEDIVHDEDVTYCQNCGIVLSASIMYSGGNKIMLPWGLLL